jgi:hypothetical protein
VSKYNGDAADHAAELHDAQVAYVQSGDAILQYVDRYNAEHDPSLLESYKTDQVNRARILQRYRLYSNQPDEMITFRALGQMHPGAGDFDPRLYQYGGLWIYPVGVLLKVLSVFNVVTVSSDLAYYLDHPEAFGRFYVIARAYSAAWGVIGVLAIFALVRRFTRSDVLGVVAAICFMVMPVVVDLAHEAKPHLPGAVLLVLAVLAGCKYADEGKGRWWILASVLAGAAVGMILVDVVAVLVIPAMVIARGDKPGRAAGILLAGGAIAAGVYFATNPYVAAHLLGNRAVLVSNLGNSEAMYPVGSLRHDVTNSIRLMAIGTSAPLAVAGLLGLLAIRKLGVGLVLAIPVLGALVLFVIGAAGKPGEYARFAIVPDIGLMVLAVCAVGKLVNGPVIRVVAGFVLIAAAAIYSVSYERGFMSDSSRLAAADQLSRYADGRTAQSAPTLAVFAEPAPYCLPPVDLFRWKIVLLPRNMDGAGYDASVRPDQTIRIWDPRLTPISWADKPFVISF